MYSAENIIWIKNVKRNGGEGWAYDDINCKKSFLLHWPTSKKGSASTPRVGDIITLFQKPNKIGGRKNYKVHLTHLVSPISDEVHLDQGNPKYKWCREVQLIAKAAPIEVIPNPGYFNFFLPNRGLTNPIINLVNNIGLGESETKDEIWRLFEPYFCTDISEQIFHPSNPVGVFGEIEGDKIIREHIKQEITRRNSRIVQMAKAEAYRNSNGRILCECCEFDFLGYYGSLGDGFIECHHKIHVSTGERITTISDLALVCSNCHRMLHRRNQDGNYLSIEELRSIIADNRSI